MAPIAHPPVPCLWQGDTLVLRIRVQPRSGRDEITGLQDDALRIRITAPPVDGKANEHLRSFLARRFKVPKSRVSLLSGETARIKRIGIERPACIPGEISACLSRGPLS